MLRMDHRRARTPRRRRTTLNVEARHRRRSHAPTRALTRRRVDGEAAGEDTRVTARGMPVSDGGGHRRVDRPSALRNLWFSAGEELPGKSLAAVTATAVAAAVVRRRSGGGEGDQNETRSPKKLGFLSWL